MTEADGRLKQGAHPDPFAKGYEAPDPSLISAEWAAALSSVEMATYRQVLGLPGRPDVRAAIIDDLATYYDLDPEECVRRCVNWESWSVEEWQAQDRSTPDGLRAFYNSTESWSFDLLWYAYLQAAGCVYPTSVIASRRLPTSAGARCLDFGSGTGDTAQLLIGLGYTVDLADVSRTLLRFAQWRLERRQQTATYLDLNDVGLPTSLYDVIIAKDVLVHVPDFAATVRCLHRALRPGGLLFANLDTRPPTAENAWHLYADDLPLRRVIHDIGFEQIGSLDGFLFVYRWVDPHGVRHLARRARSAFLLGPPRRAYRHGRTMARQLLHRA